MSTSAYLDRDVRRAQNSPVHLTHAGGRLLAYRCSARSLGQRPSGGTRGAAEQVAERKKTRPRKQPAGVATAAATRRTTVGTPRPRRRRPPCDATRMVCVFGKRKGVKSRGESTEPAPPRFASFGPRVLVLVRCRLSPVQGRWPTGPKNTAIPRSRRRQCLAGGETSITFHGVRRVLCLLRDGYTDGEGTTTR